MKQFLTIIPFLIAIAFPPTEILINPYMPELRSWQYEGLRFILSIDTGRIHVPVWITLLIATAAIPVIMRILTNKKGDLRKEAAP